MSTCPICSHDMPAKITRGRRYLLTRVYCSKFCAADGMRALILARESEVDEVAVFRLLEGWQVASTRSERIEAVRVLTGKGRSAAWIADYLRTTRRSVERYRHEIHNRGEAA